MDFDANAERLKYGTMDRDDLVLEVVDCGEQLDGLLRANNLECKYYHDEDYSSDYRYWNKTRLIERLLLINKEIAELRAKEPPPPPPIQPEVYEARIEELTHQLEEKEETINTLQAELAEKQTAANAAAAALAAAQAEAQQSAADLAAAQAEAQQTAADLAAAQAEAQQSAADLATAQATITDLNSQLDSVKQAEATALAEIETLRQQLTEAQNQPIDTAAVDRLTAELADVRNKLRSCIKTQQETMKSNNRLKQQLTALTAERNKLAPAGSSPKPVPPPVKQAQNQPQQKPGNVFELPAFFS